MPKSARHRARGLKRKLRKKRQLEQVRQAGIEVKEGESPETALRELKVKGLAAGSREAGIAEIFGEAVATIRSQMQEVREGNKIKRPAHNAAVDLKLEFKSLDRKGKGLIFKSEQKESSISMQIMTRILPEGGEG